jgi:cardiolipin synthase
MDTPTHAPEPAPGPQPAGHPPGQRRAPGREPLWLRLPRPVFTGGNEVELLRGGDELFPAMRAAIDHAMHEVWLATYIFHHDDAALALCHSLKAAANRGVRVRVVVDGFGSLASLGRLQAEFEGSGVALAVFRPLHRWWSWLQPGQLRRLHQKLCVVDGQWGFAGGINIIDDRLDLSHGLTDQPRLDFALQVRGPVVAPIEQSVRAVWGRAWLGRDWGEELLAMARSSEPMTRLRQMLRSLRLPRGDGFSAERGELAPVLAAFVLRDNLRQRRTIERSYIAALQSARQRIDIISPYFYPGHAFRRALCQAAKRGVTVRLLLQGKVDYRIAAMAATALYDELLSHGVQIFEYTPAFLHAKVAVVDDDWCTVGSSNIDPLSLLLNLEANLIVRDAAIARELSQCFEQASAASRHIEPRQTNRRGLWPLARRALVAWLAHVYLQIAGAGGRY